MSDDRGALYPAVAESLRARIVNGEYPPGRVLPSERQLATDLELSRDTIRRAIDALHHEGLVVVRPGYRTHVADYSGRHVVELPPCAEVDCRPPTPEERKRWDLGPGVPVFVVNGKVYPRDRYVLRTSS